MFISDDGDDHYFSTVPKKHFNTGIVRFLEHRAKPLGFFTVYLMPEDLAEGLISEVEGGPVVDGCTYPGSRRGDPRDQVGKCIRHDVRSTCYEYKVTCVLQYECQVVLLAAKCRR